MRSVCGYDVTPIRNNYEILLIFVQRQLFKKFRKNEKKCVVAIIPTRIFLFCSVTPVSQSITNLRKSLAIISISQVFLKYRSNYRSKLIIYHISFSFFFFLSNSFRLLIYFPFAPNFIRKYTSAY